MNVKKVIIGFFFIAILLIAVEIIIGNWFSNKKILINGNIPFNVEWKFPYYNEVNLVDNFIYIRNGDGLREEIDKNANKVVFVFGGSNVDQRRIPLEYTTTYQLNKNNDSIFYLNMGIDGHTIIGNLYSIKNWVKLLNIQREKNLGAIIVLSLNDAALPFYNIAYDQQILELNEIPERNSGIRKLYLITKNLYDLKSKNNSHLGHSKIDYEKINYSPKEISYENHKLIILNSEKYRLYLKSFISELKLLGLNSFLCLSYPNTLTKRTMNIHDGNYGFDNSYYDGNEIKMNSLEFSESYKSNLKVMEEECLKAGGFFKDIQQINENKYFYNHAHLNITGQMIYNNIVENTISKNNIFKGN